MTVTLNFTPDEVNAGDARRALAADALVAVLWNLREELRRVARGKTDATEVEQAEADRWYTRLQDELANEGINLDALWC